MCVHVEASAQSGTCGGSVLVDAVAISINALMSSRPVIIAHVITVTVLKSQALLACHTARTSQPGRNANYHVATLHPASTGCSRCSLLTSQQIASCENEAVSHGTKVWAAPGANISLCPAAIV